MYIIDESLSKRLTSIRFMLIVLVVFIHNNLSEVKFIDSTEIFFIPEYVRIIRTLISDIIARSAVPLFFLISGFLLYAKCPMYLTNLKKKVKSILVPYILWILLSVLFFYVAQNISFTKQYFANPGNIIKNFRIIDWVDIFFGKFTQRAPYPLVYQFWFLRDLFVLNLLFSIIKVIIDKMPLGYFLILILLWINSTNIYIVSPEALLFFSIGYYIVKYQISIDSIDSISTKDIVIAYLLFIILELFFCDNFILVHKINIILGSIFLLKLTKYFIRNNQLYCKLAWLEEYSFFVYAFHEPLLTVLKKISVKIIPMHDEFLLVQYFLVVILGVTVSLLIGIVINKVMPKIYSILTGERRKRLTTAST